MVFKRSEYGLQFKKSHLVKNVPEYYNNVAYRTHRRELEHAHTPLSWDCEDYSESKTSSDDGVSDLLQKKLEVTETVEEKQTDDLVNQAKNKLQKYESKDNQNTDGEKVQVDKLVSEENDDTKGDNDDKHKQSTECDDEVKESKTEQCKSETVKRPKGLKTYICKQNKDLKLDLKNVDEKLSKKKLKPKPSERPQSAPSYKPPFYAYGCGDKERETGVKRSFNVRASNDVYPAAMKALVSLHEQQRKREKARRCLSARERKRKALVQEKAAKEVAGWQSEYRRRYPQYSSEEYARSQSRLQERPSCFKPYKF